jgi:hypothetical protein
MMAHSLARGWIKIWGEGHLGEGSDLTATGTGIVISVRKVLYVIFLYFP